MSKNLAIAYNMSKRAKRMKMAQGGPVQSSQPSPNLPGAQSAQDSMRKAFKFAHGGECPSCGYAEGGQVRGVHTPDDEYSAEKHPGRSKAGDEVRDAKLDMPEYKNDAIKHVQKAKDEHFKVLGQLHHMKKPNLQGLADGGEVESEDKYDDLVDRIMDKRCNYSEGGKVANQEHGEYDNDLAGFSPNEFDDLVLRDDLESSYGDYDNAGDSLGNDQEDEDRDDIVSRIMASRRKKDRNPRPA